MPRAVSGTNELGRARTRRYREGLEALAKPEASHVDTAIAAALTGLLAVIEERNEPIPDVLKILIASTFSVLHERGFDDRSVKKKTIARIQLRRDKEMLQQAVSPHYFRIMNRKTVEAGSDGGSAR